MCGRFTQAYTWEELVALYRLTMPPVNTQPSYNVCPTDPIDMILPAENAATASPEPAGDSCPIGGRSR
jgi:putative SOS response-associated peptidase YedK